MNRRQFFKSLATVIAGFSILPSAVTYSRAAWKKSSNLWVVNPEWINAPYEFSWVVFGGPFPSNMGETIRPVEFPSGAGEILPFRFKKPDGPVIPPWIKK